MLTKEAKQELTEQAYRVVGDHSAVKTCGWTKSYLKGEGGCYKLTFYGIQSHQCMQCTTSISCANRCVFCWRGYKAPVSKEWKWVIDEPEVILKGLIAGHHHLLNGYKGNEKVSKERYNQSLSVRHVALSLTGEPIIYPRINELIDLFHKNKISTFLVTNAQYPEQIKTLRPITQLYLSVDAPNKELLKNVDVPLFSDYWERLLQSLDYMKQKKQRTTVRLTMVKGLNMIEPEKYAELIKRGSPDFIEVKGYVCVGASRERLTIQNMPLHEEVVEFSQQLLLYLLDYDIVAEHIPSRVVMFAKKKFKKGKDWYTWIDFDKFFDLIEFGAEFSTDDYLAKTPGKLGLSGKGTKDYINPHTKKKLARQKMSEADENKVFIEKDA